MLALIALVEGAASGSRLVDVVFVLVVALTLLQCTTLPWVARRLRVVQAAGAREIEVDAAPLDTLRADLLQMTVPVGSKMHGVYVRELRLPEGSGLSLVVRDGTSFTPQGASRIQEGDQLLVVTTQAAREPAEERIRAVDRSGRMARWLGAGPPGPPGPDGRAGPRGSGPRG